MLRASMCVGIGIPNAKTDQLPDDHPAGRDCLLNHHRHIFLISTRISNADAHGLLGRFRSSILHPASCDLRFGSGSFASRALLRQTPRLAYRHALLRCQIGVAQFYNGVPHAGDT